VRILYVEDVLPNLALVERIASMGNHQVIHYPTAEEALAHLADDQPDLILADIHLEGPMNGIEFVRQVRAQGWTQPTVVVTAYETGNVRAESFEAGCNAFLSKPLQVRELWHLIQTYDTDLNPGP